MFWLVIFAMYVSEPSTHTTLHAGNFRTMEECQTAAKGANFIRTQTIGMNVAASYLCVRASGEGIQPPPG